MKPIQELITRLEGLRGHLAFGEQKLRHLAKSRSNIVDTAATEADRNALLQKAIAEIEWELADHQFGLVSLADGAKESAP